MIKISERLRTVASLVTEGNRLADIGTDHGYVPIYLLEQNKIPSAIAMDIGRGPLECAREHILRYGMGEYIQTRLSDGVAAIEPGEADSIVIAGMGGGLVMHIIESGAAVCQRAEELILQPQSELAKVRNFLEKQGYVTDAEAMVAEEGKFYPMMRVHYAPQNIRLSGLLFHIYGKQLLESGNPVLYEYLIKEREIYQGILLQLDLQPESERSVKRRAEVEESLFYNKKAFEYYKSVRPCKKKTV